MPVTPSTIQRQICPCPTGAPTFCAPAPPIIGPGTASTQRVVVPPGKVLQINAWNIPIGGAVRVNLFDGAECASGVAFPFTPCGTTQLQLTPTSRIIHLGEGTYQLAVTGSTAGYLIKPADMLLVMDAGALRSLQCGTCSTSTGAHNTVVTESTSVVFCDAGTAFLRWYVKTNGVVTSTYNTTVGGKPYTPTAAATIGQCEGAFIVDIYTSNFIRVGDSLVLTLTNGATFVVPAAATDTFLTNTSLNTGTSTLDFLLNTGVVVAQNVDEVREWGTNSRITYGVAA